MKNQTGTLYFSAFRSLFLILLMLAGPVFSSPFFEESELESDFSAAQLIPADEFSDLDSSDEGFVDCDSECDDQEVEVNPFLDEGFIDSDLPEGFF